MDATDNTQGGQWLKLFSSPKGEGKRPVLLLSLPFSISPSPSLLLSLWGKLDWIVEKVRFGCDSDSSGDIDGTNNGGFMDLLFGSAFFQAIIMGWSWLLLVFSLCFGSISASMFLSLMHGYGFSSGEFGFVSCFMGDVLGYYRFETIKLICLWPCVALSGGVLYKFDDVITSSMFGVAFQGRLF
ncbi:Hypothetical predicted protein [Prunus dulcis]|uniref:Uncharacterized protein n=1 Tax=Prunus dulcis TaxID=3755 RepID=A0A5E4GGB5_PRUDU|nr:hypothetical protein L3X38_037592 [Prunus dulcis]VVA38806.1 Hypothetical predicted protein [Prunus dulcis]